VKPWLWWLLGAAGAAVGVVIMVRGQTTSGPAATIYHRERADGVDQRLQDFLDAWAQSGPFDLVVMPDGGVRTDEAKQAQLYADGKSGAATLAQTPHGHAGAIDVGPYINGAVPWDRWDLFEQIGQFGKSYGLTWGGDFSHLKDGPHLEVPDWKDLPLPGGYA
jgi:hypothetical protein